MRLFPFVSVHGNIFVHVHAARRLLKGSIRSFPASRGHCHSCSHSGEMTGVKSRYHALSRPIRSPFALDAVRRQLKPLATKGHQSFVDFGHNMCRVLFTLNTKIPSTCSSPMLVLGNHPRVSGNGRGHLHDGMTPNANNPNRWCLCNRCRRMRQGLLLAPGLSESSCGLLCYSCLIGWRIQSCWRL